MSQPAAPSRPDWLPEKFFDAVKGPNYDEFGKHFNEVATRDAAEQVRRLSLPQKPEEYKLELPKDFKLPVGVEFKFDPAKPEYSKFQQIAVKHGLTQDAVTDLLGTYAETMVGTQQSTEAWKAAEVQKLGANGPARVTAVETFLNGVIGSDKSKQLMSVMVSAGAVEAFESLVGKFSTQGTASFTQAFREPREANGRVSNEQFAKMSGAERLDYTRRFDQTQFQKSA